MIQTNHVCIHVCIFVFLGSAHILVANQTIKTFQNKSSVPKTCHSGGFITCIYAILQINSIIIRFSVLFEVVADLYHVSCYVICTL